MDEITRLRKENSVLKETVSALSDKVEAYACLEPRAAIAQAVDFALSGIAIIDNMWKVRYANPAMIKLWGYGTIDEVIKTPTSRYFDESSFTKLGGILKEIVANGSWKGELTGKKKDGSIFPILAVGSRIFDNPDVSAGVIVSCIDLTDYRQAISALTESETRYRTTLDHLGDSVYLVDRDLVLLYVNRRISKYSEFFGVNLSEYIGRKISDLDVEFVRSMESGLRRVIETGEPLITEDELRGFSEKILLQIRRIPILNNGRVTHVVTVLHNITDQKQNEERLRQSEQKYRAIADNVPVGIVIHVEGSLKYIGDEGARMLGYTADELIGRSATDFIHMDDRTLVVERLKKRISGQEVPNGYEVRLIRKDGELLPALIYGNIIDYLGKKAIQGIFINISRRKLAERELEETLQRLRQSERQHRLLVESSHDAIAVIRDTKMTFINRKMLQLVGYRESELIDRAFTDVVHLEDRQVVLDNYLRRIRGEHSPSRYEFRLVNKNGDPVFVEVNVVLSEWEGEKASVCFLRDITDRKMAEKERTLLFDQLLSAQKMEAIGTLAGGMAHNFNNILVGIMGYSEYLLAKRDEADPEYKAIKTIHEGSIKASELTRQLLNIARGGEFKQRMRLSLNDVIDRVMPLISGTFNKSIEIKTILDPGPVIMEGDIGQIEQSLLNICINARDAMPHGGRLLIETYSYWLDEEFVKLHLGAKVGTYVVLSVSDTGTGMPPQVRDHIFEPFFTTKKHMGGTGMGLATVWGIVTNHGGIVSVYTEPGSGTTFKLYFPAVYQETQKEENGREEIIAGKGETLLLVDDESIIREMWGEILDELGYAMLLAGDGDEALSILKERDGAVDLIILDMVMPHKGGKETFALIRERYPSAKVLVSSGYTENGEVHEMIEAGADGFIQKPYQIRLLAAKLREILDAGKREA